MYPKVCTNRNDANSQVVVANAEQEAQLPDEYRSNVLTGAGETISGADHAANVMLSPEYDKILADREQLEADRLALAQDRAALEEQRANLTAGYQESMDKLEADREQLDEDQRQFEAAKAGEQPTSDGATASADTSPAPVKRTRTARES